MDSSVSRFWDNFINKSISYGIKPVVVRWYVKHAEDYIKAHKTRRLAEHTPQILERYLNEIGRQSNLKDWQFVQVVDALHILFVYMVASDWARDFQWDYWRGAARVMPSK